MKICRWVILMSCLVPCFGWAADRDQPNFVVILTDDQGYGDLGVFGATDIETPRIDQIAAEGLRLNSFYMPVAVCTPSRAGLLTGCHPVRLGLGHRVLFPFSQTGLHPDEITMAELLRGAGYRSICIGKWHLGHLPEFLPLQQGFHEYFGVPYSNDMDAHYYRHLDFQSPPLPLYRDREIIEQGPDQSQLTRRFTDAAIEFIRENQEGPFLVYLAHCMPHLPIHASESFRGRSAAGLYGDVIEEIDHEVGRIYDCLVDCGIDQSTMIIFTSDNGPWRQGSSGPLRGKKNTTWEGGHRVPCVMRYPKGIPAGATSNEIVSAMDLLPTIAELAGVDMPNDRVVDGVSVLEHLGSPADIASPRTTHVYYKNNQLQAIRRGKWKLHVYRPEWKQETRDPLLYDLQADLGEQNDVAAANPQIVEDLLAIAEEVRADLGDARLGRKGENVRAVGTINK